MYYKIPGDARSIEHVVDVFEYAVYVFCIPENIAARRGAYFCLSVSQNARSSMT